MQNKILFERQLKNIIKQILKENIEDAIYAEKIKRYEESLKKAGIDRFLAGNQSFKNNPTLLDEPLNKFAGFILSYKKQYPDMGTGVIKYEAERAARSILSAVVIPGLRTIRETLKDVQDEKAKKEIFAANKDLLDNYFKELKNTIISRKQTSKSENSEIFNKYIDELISYLETYWSKVSALDVDGFAETKLFFENKKIHRGRFVK